jgi:hypothetical protein
VVERSERYASVAKPEEPRDIKRRARAGLLAAGFSPPLNSSFRAERPEGEARKQIHRVLFQELLIEFSI